MNKERIYYWDNLKGLLILLVIIGHYVEYLMKPYPELTFIWTFIYSFHMPAFIVVCGYFLGKSRKNPVDKIPRILLLYMLMEVLYLVRELVFSQKVTIDFANPEFGCWYLLFLVYGYVVAYFVKKKVSYWHLIVAFVISLMSGFDVTITAAWGVQRSLYFMPYLLVGMCCDIDRIVKKVREKRLLCAGMFLAIQVSLVVVKNKAWFDRKFFRGAEVYGDLTGSVKIDMLGRGISHLVAILLVVFLLAIITEKNTILAKIGGHTLVLYLVHTYILKVFMPLLQDVGIENIWFRLIIISVMVVLVTAIISSRKMVKNECD